LTLNSYSPASVTSVSTTSPYSNRPLQKTLTTSPSLGVETIFSKSLSSSTIYQSSMCCVPTCRRDSPLTSGYICIIGIETSTTKAFLGLSKIFPLTLVTIILVPALTLSLLIPESVDSSLCHSSILLSLSTILSPLTAPSILNHSSLTSSTVATSIT